MNVKKVRICLADSRPQLEDAIWRDGIRPEMRGRQVSISIDADTDFSKYQPTPEFRQRVKTVQYTAVITMGWPDD